MIPSSRTSSGEEHWRVLRDEVELLGAGREYDLEAVRAGKLSPVFSLAPPSPTSAWSPSWSTS